MSLKIEDVKVGDDLECIDDNYAFKVLINKIGLELKVTRIYDHAFKLGDYIFNSSDIKYFKKKEQSQYTFDDLIDVARKAFKDAKIFSFDVTDCAVGIRLLDKSEKIFTLMDICSGVVFIQSLYKETFVIECEEDCKRIKQNAKITFLNGNSVVMDQPPVGDGIVRIWNDGRYDFAVLKGATVEQERGCNE